MKTLFIITSILLISSCGSLPKADMKPFAAKRFVMDTACTEFPTITPIGEMYNFMGQYNGGSYLFTCGEEKYACKIVYNSASYSYMSRCNLKLSSKR